jgi:hypothetical protein
MSFVEIANSMINDMDFPMCLWVEACNIIVYILNMFSLLECVNDFLVILDYMDMAFFVMLFFNKSLYCKKGLSHKYHGNRSLFIFSYIIEVKEAL